MTSTWPDLVFIRLLYSMSDQFAELKMILYNSSNSTSTSGPIATDVRVDVASDNSDPSSSDSDFTFPAPAATSAAFSSPNPNSFQLMVQDLSTTEVSGLLDVLIKLYLHIFIKMRISFHWILCFRKQLMIQQFIPCYIIFPLIHGRRLLTFLSLDGCTMQVLRTGAVIRRGHLMTTSDGTNCFLLA